MVIIIKNNFGNVKNERKNFDTLRKVDPWDTWKTAL